MSEESYNDEFATLFEKQIAVRLGQFSKAEKRRNEACARKAQGDDSAAAEVKAMEKKMGEIYLNHKQIMVASAKQRREETEMASEDDPLMGPTRH